MFSTEEGKISQVLKKINDEQRGNVWKLRPVIRNARECLFTNEGIIALDTDGKMLEKKVYQVRFATLVR